MKKLLILIFLLSACSTKNEGVLDVLPEELNDFFPESTVFNCTFDKIIDIAPEYQTDGSDIVKYKISDSETPIELTFVLSEGKILMKGNNGESELIQTKIDGMNGIVLHEVINGGFVSTYNIFLERKIGIWTKTNEFFGDIYTMTSVGRCV